MAAGIWQQQYGRSPQFVINIGYRRPHDGLPILGLGQSPAQIIKSGRQAFPLRGDVGLKTHPLQQIAGDIGDHHHNPESDYVFDI